MFRGYLITLLIIVSTPVFAQDEMVLASDSLHQQHDKVAQGSRISQPKQLEISREDAMKMADRLPSFGVYRDNYFATGIPLNEKVTNQTADAAFQISIRNRITKSILPFNTFAYFTYTQKSFWDIYAESSPFRDTNYNPGLGLGKYLFRDNKLTGAAFVQIMHESNGCDGDDSRAWDYLSLSMKYYLNAHLNLSGELWLPYVAFGKNSEELIDYKGYGRLSVDYVSNKNKWWLSADILPRKGFANINTALTAAFRLSERSNQYLFARFFQGYGESQKDYSKYVINIRIGICIKPDFYSIF
ncbi:putative phospholipase A1 [termite gut metagenome]|uniref:Phosphatidylcholine 1-acylhydrolase n=1 Tax=termite gut metagenome TaxID=433724 RepID=A0A5J4RPF9_9ZZZZ